MACLSISLASLCLLAAFCAVPGGAERTAASLPVPQRRRRSHRLAQGRHDVVEARCELVRDRGNEVRLWLVVCCRRASSGGRQGGLCRKAGVAPR